MPVRLKPLLGEPNKLLTLFFFHYNSLLHINETIMNRYHILIIRSVLGLVFAVIATRIFFGRVSIGFVVALAVFMVGMAYLSAYLRLRKKNK